MISEVDTEIVKSKLHSTSLERKSHMIRILRQKCLDEMYVYEYLCHKSLMFFSQTEGVTLMVLRSPSLVRSLHFNYKVVMTQKPQSILFNLYFRHLTFL